MASIKEVNPTIISPLYFIRECEKILWKESNISLTVHININQAFEPVSALPFHNNAFNSLIDAISSKL